MLLQLLHQLPVSATAASCNVMFSIVVYSCYRAFNAVFRRIGRSGSLEVIFQFIQMSPGFIVRHWSMSSY